MDLRRPQKTEERRIRAAQLVQLAELSGWMAHKTRNPLSVILSGLQLLELQANLIPEEAEVLESVVAEVRKLGRIVEQDLGASSFGVTGVRMISIGSSVHRALEAGPGGSAKRSVGLDIVPSEGDVRVAFAPGGFAKVVQILARHARDRSREGERVRVKWEVLPPKETGRLFPGFEGEVARLAVGWFPLEEKKDGAGGGPSAGKTPCGRDAGHCNGLHPPRRGLGLDLAVELAEAHGGVVLVEQAESRRSIAVHLPTGDRPSCGMVREGDCEACELSAWRGTLCCWYDVGKMTRIETGDWLVSCRRCEYFANYNLQRWYADS